MSIQTSFKEKKTGLSESERLILANERLLSEMYGISKRRYLDVTILDNEYLVEILSVCTIVKHSRLGRYTTITDCAFMEYDRTPVLAIELRNGARTDLEEVTVVVAEVRLEGNPMTMGFIVDTVKDFYRKIL